MKLFAASRCQDFGALAALAASKAELATWRGVALCFLLPTTSSL